MAIRKSNAAGPSVLETIRLNLTVFERAVAAGDEKTAIRSWQALPAMLKGLRDVASGQGVDVGDTAGEDARDVAIAKALPEPPRQPCVLPTAPDLLPSGAEDGIRDAIQAFLDDQRRALRLVMPVGWLDVTSPSWSILARLTWHWVRCAAGLVWRGLRWVFRGARGRR